MRRLFCRNSGRVDSIVNTIDESSKDEAKEVSISIVENAEKRIQTVINSVSSAEVNSERI